MITACNMHANSGIIDLMLVEMFPECKIDVNFADEVTLGIDKHKIGALHR